MPTNWPCLGPQSFILGGLAQRNARLSLGAPSEFAKRLGVPVLQASHCGHFSGRFNLIAGLSLSVPYSTHFVGATQIVDAQGKVLVSRHTDQGPGIVYAEIEIPRTPVRQKYRGKGYWVPELPWLMRRYWAQQNWATAPIYAQKGRQLGLAAAKQTTLNQLPEENNHD